MVLYNQSFKFIWCTCTSQSSVNTSFLSPILSFRYHDMIDCGLFWEQGGVLYWVTPHDPREVWKQKHDIVHSSSGFPYKAPPGTLDTSSGTGSSPRWWFSACLTYKLHTPAGDIRCPPEWCGRGHADWSRNLSGLHQCIPTHLQQNDGYL